jgi:hypothetical protein
MPFIPLSSIVTLHDPYLYGIILPVNTGHNKLSFVFNKPNIIPVISLRDRWRRWKQAIDLPLHVKCKYVSLLSKPMK